MDRKIVYKPWGKEEWLELNNIYCYKRIYINAGYKTSYQYHNFKRETNYIISGTAEIWLENDNGVVEKTILTDGDYFNVIPPRKHRVIAITDIILQEVSSPEVDDVIRVEDDTHRVNGKIDNEHKTPAVLILTVGKGTRLGNLTKNINKTLLPINNRAIISHIIDKFPTNYEFIIALGYKGESVKEYCEISHPNIKFTFINVNNIDGPDSGPGYSTLQCKNYLQRPFYFVVDDCIIDSKIPTLNENWLGVYPTSYPEKYSTIKSDDQKNILEIVNKNENGFSDAFIGLAGIWDYNVFWSELESNIKNGEMISAFFNPQKYSSLKTKHLKWLDTGNLDDLNKTKEYFNDIPISLHKITDEIAYKESKFIKFNPDENYIKNKTERANILNHLIPSGYNSSKFFLYYNWENGKTLYEHDSEEIYNKFLDFYDKLISKSNVIKSSKETIDSFYVDKTDLRKQKFISRFGNDYYTQSHIINGKPCDSMKNLLSTLDLSILYKNPMYDLFHGDLQFDNVLFDDVTNKFTYIDWRDTFGGITEGGDLYYDLAKLYGGCIIPYNLTKNESFIQYQEGLSIINYSYNIPKNLINFKSNYESWLLNKKIDLNIIKLITTLIFLNMSPLHSDNFSKMLWFKSIEMLMDFKLMLC